MIKEKYAMIKTGGKQIKVIVGQSIWIEKIEVDQDKPVIFDEVVVVFDGDNLEIGKPILKATVTGKVEKHGKGKKIRILRTKAKSNWKTLKGHRQPYTKVLVEKIELDGKVIAKYVPPAKIVKVEKKPEIKKISKTSGDTTKPMIESKADKTPKIEKKPVTESKPKTPSTKTVTSSKKETKPVAKPKTSTTPKTVKKATPKPKESVASKTTKKPTAKPKTTTAPKTAKKSATKTKEVVAPKKSPTKSKK